MFEHLFGFTGAPDQQDQQDQTKLGYPDPAAAFDLGDTLVDTTHLPNLAFLSNTDLQANLHHHVQEPDPFAALHDTTHHGAHSLHPSTATDTTSFTAFADLDQSSHALTQAAFSALYPPVDMSHITPMLSVPAILPPVHDERHTTAHKSVLGRRKSRSPEPHVANDTNITPIGSEAAPNITNITNTEKTTSIVSDSTSGTSKSSNTSSINTTAAEKASSSSTTSKPAPLNPTTSVLQPDDLEPPSKKTKHRRRFGERAPWTAKEDKLLRAAVEEYGDKTEKWSRIAECVPGRTNKNCRKRWFHSLDPKLRKGAWTPEEDEILCEAVKKFHSKWSKIADLLEGRTDDQCAKRWRESLDPAIDRSKWSVEEDELLMHKFTEMGSQWQKIATFFEGRPGLHCRNRWRKLQRITNARNEDERRKNSHGNPLDAPNSPTSSASSASDPLDTAIASCSASSSNQRMHPFISSHHHPPPRPQSPSLGSAAARINANGSTSNASTTPPPSIAFHDKRQQDYEAPEPLAHLNPYGCDMPACQAAFRNSNDLFYHMKNFHPDIATIAKPYRCGVPKCNKKYKNINGLQYHLREAKGTTGHAYALANPNAANDESLHAADDAIEPIVHASSTSASSSPSSTSTPLTIFQHETTNTRPNAASTASNPSPNHHKRQRRDDTTFICPIYGCRKKFDSVDALHQHQDMNHAPSHTNHAAAAAARASNTAPANAPASSSSSSSSSSATANTSNSPAKSQRPPTQQQFRIKREKWIIESV
ncbi:hypothetical protein BC940DRAFT_257414 [Gongronella butleri]|nr:hypothetical protein BC940DRAFT_257414 [Gongronella butleri]